MPRLPLSEPPESLCLLRLSAIGDVTHVLPLIATLRQFWPQTRITWIIGKLEHQLVRQLEGVEFIVFDKSRGIDAYRELKQRLRGRHFDVLLAMQVALRANLLGRLIPADLRLGFDPARARDFHSLFVNARIQGPPRVHVLDGFFQFLETLGIGGRRMDWLLRANEQERAWAAEQIAGEPTVVINPCSSARRNNYRNWPAGRQARVIDWLHERDIRVILTGGPDAAERAFADEITRLCRQAPQNRVGQTTLGQLLALLEQARALVAPDTGPAHMGTVAGIPVIGLYASSNPLRTGPYNSLEYCVNAYPEALRRYNGKRIEQARWGERVRDPRVMELIGVDQVIERLCAVPGLNDAIR
jgi:heptosyltransferase I